MYYTKSIYGIKNEKKKNQVIKLAIYLYMPMNSFASPRCSNTLK